MHSFIKGALRSAAQRWPPKHAVKKEAWRKKGKYLCAGYRKRSHIVPVTILNNKRKRINNVFVDHIDPVIDPNVGWVSWDIVIKRMFVEQDGLQVLCKDCHDNKTRDERNCNAVRTRTRKHGEDIS
jgi:hypothetical protein